MKRFKRIDYEVHHGVEMDPKTLQKDEKKSQKQ